MRRVQAGMWMFLLLLAVAVITMPLTGCPKPPSSEDVTAPPEDVTPPEEPGETAVTPPQGEPYKIGGIFALTGKAAALGQPEADTAKMIVEQINAEGGINGRPVEIIIRDTKGDETEGLAAAKELIENQKVLALVGPSRSGTTLGLIDYIEKAQVPLISCAAAAKITTPVKKWVFKTPQTDKDAVATIYNYLNDKGISRIATITVSNAYGDSGLEELKAQADDAGITITTSEQSQDSDTDMTAQLTRIKGTNPEAVICWGVGPAPALVTKNMKQLQMDIPLIQSHGVANRRFIEAAGDAAEGVILPAGKLLVADQLPDDDPQKQVLLDYAAAFKAKYDRDADTFGGHAWDAVQMVINALKSGAEDPAAIRDAIESTTNFVGIGGVFNYSAEDHYGLTPDAFVVIVIKDGEWKLAD
ncbi:MAG: ABC transporter substrate-binding protein [Armatimonadetes bacterium]|nr:ABC transporter substrate-binding protein [Armatimonadota bacterium]